MHQDTDEIATLRDKLPVWVMFVSCEGYGPMPEEKVAYLEADLRETAAKYGLDVQTDVSGISAEELARLLPEPSPEPYWKLRLKGGFSDIFFLTTLGKTPEFSGIISELTQNQRFPAGNIGAYIQPVVQGTSCHCEFNLYYDPTDKVFQTLWRMGRGGLPPRR